MLYATCKTCHQPIYWDNVNGCWRNRHNYRNSCFDGLFSGNTPHQPMDTSSGTGGSYLRKASKALKELREWAKRDLFAFLARRTQ